MSTLPMQPNPLQLNLCNLTNDNLTIVNLTYNNPTYATQPMQPSLQWPNLYQPNCQNLCSDTVSAYSGSVPIPMFSPRPRVPLPICFRRSPSDFPRVSRPGPDRTPVRLRPIMLFSSSRHTTSLVMHHLSVAPSVHWWARIVDLPTMPSRRA